MIARILTPIGIMIVIASTAFGDDFEVLHRMKINPRPSEPHTSFQTPLGYRPDHDIRTDAVIVYSSDKNRTQSWKDRGYSVQTMYGFRTYADYIKEHPEEGQTMANGEILTCGPGSYYMVPTQSRIDAALKFFREAIEGGTEAVVPEEPEYFTQTGYAESFKREWQDYYGEPWQDQTSSIEARWKSGRLKGYLQYRMVKSILSDAKAVDPNITRMVAAHSAVSYYNWGIIYPHYDVLMLPEFQELIGQVWTGTARTPCKYEGVNAERTFENGYLEYSSLWNLMRGTGKRLWFLMDPLEDNPDRSMEDYQTNYERTLVASLMFPEVDEYEVMPWPDRIFGRVPGRFATKIMTIVTMLGDMHNQKKSEVDAGTQGIATFVADSMAWQRGEPHPSRFDGVYGITLPLLMKGIPVQVAQLERVLEPDYLNAYKVLLLSYDAMKPMNEAYNNALAKWVRDGGSLVLFGGTDAYNDLPEWWKEKGFSSPDEHLLSELGIEVRDSVSLGSQGEFHLLSSEDRPIRDASNRALHTVDLSDHVIDGRVYVKIEDSLKHDGWGPSIWTARLRVDGRTTAYFRVGTDEEKKHLLLDTGSHYTGEVRFADAQAFIIYEFEVPAGNKVELVLDMCNQFRISAATSLLSAEHRFKSLKKAPTAGRSEFEVIRSIPVTAYDTNAAHLYSVEGTKYSPFFEAKVGKGTFIFCGIAPEYFASSRESADMLRSIARYACGKAETQYREQHYMKVRRGRYVAARAFDKPVTIEGTFVDVLDPALPLRTNPEVLADGLTVLADVSEMLADNKPRYLLSSSRLEASLEEESTTALLLSGPKGTSGTVRIFTAGKQLRSIKLLNASGGILPFEQKTENATIAIAYDDSPDGVLIKVEWQ